MAYTEPRTWTDTEFIDDDIMNAHVRDNFRAMGPHLIVRKTADESVVSSATLQDDDALSFPVAANEVWLFRLLLLIQTGGAGGMKSSWSFPASGVMEGTKVGFDGPGSNTISQYRLTVSDGSTITYLSSLTAPRMFMHDGVYTNAGTGGTVQFRWAQDSSNGTACIVKANSTLWGVRLSP